MGVSIAGQDGGRHREGCLFPHELGWTRGPSHLQFSTSHLVAEPPYHFLKSSVLLGPALLELSTRRSIPLAGLFGFIGFFGNE